MFLQFLFLGLLILLIMSMVMLCSKSGPGSDRVWGEVDLLWHSNKSHLIPHKSDPSRPPNSSQECKLLGWSNNIDASTWRAPCRCLHWPIHNGPVFLPRISNGTIYCHQFLLIIMIKVIIEI